MTSVVSFTSVPAEGIGRIFSAHHFYLQMLLPSLYRCLSTIVLVICLIPISLSGQPVSINNTIPRKDTEGNIIDAHDGRLIKFDETYYLYGTAYGNTDGYGTTNHFHCYKSSDLTAWTACGDILNSPPTGVYYRPHVIYNATNQKYVLW